MSLQRHMTIICLITLFIINVLVCWQNSLFSSKQQRSSSILIHSGIAINSFNPSLIHFILNSQIAQSNSVSIIDNNSILVQLFKLSDTSTITMTLLDGFHHLDIVIIDEIQNIEFYQELNISTGAQFLLVTVLDQQYKPVRNISVHLELVDYAHISLDRHTNSFGEVIFRHLPRQTQVYIEAICMKSKRHAFVEINTLHYQNMTLILKEMSALHYDEYDPSDQGYYAV